MTTTASSLTGPSTLDVTASPKPLQSAMALTAAATRLTSKKTGGAHKSSEGGKWQEDCWAMFDLVGEQHFLVNTLAARTSQARFFVGRRPSDLTEDIVRLDPSETAYQVFDTFTRNGGMTDVSIKRGMQNLKVAGEYFLVGIPQTTSGDARDPLEGIGPEGSVDEVALDDLKWSVMSTNEITRGRDGTLTLTGEGADPSRKYAVDEVFLIRIWEPHPRKWSEADSPTRASLPVLRELVGLTEGVSALIDSRLAGAGLLVVAQGVDRALKAAMGLPEDDPSSPFADALIEAMTTPLSDRSSASAVVPLVVTVPDELVEKIKHLDFSSGLDPESRELREEAIRRLALGQDCPPELLLGSGSLNHWGAWLVREDVVTTHIEPPLALICDAITTQFLWPVLEGMGMSPDEYRDIVVWYDVDHMVSRPNQSSDAKDLHASGVISDAALRDATGFDESDAPQVTEAQTDVAVMMALDLAKSAPSLAQNPGLDVLTQQIRGLLEGADTSTSTPATDDTATDDAETRPSEGDTTEGVPDQEESTGPEDVLQASASTVTLALGSADRTLEAVHVSSDEATGPEGSTTDEGTA